MIFPKAKAISGVRTDEARVNILVLLSRVNYSWVSVVQRSRALPVLNTNLISYSYRPKQVRASPLYFFMALFFFNSLLIFVQVFYILLNVLGFFTECSVFYSNFPPFYRCFFYCNFFRLHKKSVSRSKIFEKVVREGGRPYFTM